MYVTFRGGISNNILWKFVTYVAANKVGILLEIRDLCYRHEN